MLLVAACKGARCLGEPVKIIIAVAVLRNYLDRNFSATRLAEKWVSDLTYIRTQEGWPQLTAVLDLADSKVVGRALRETMEVEVTSVAAWRMAVRNRPITKSLLFHSDRGVQYACREFRNQLKDMPVLQRKSRKGNCSRQCRS
jgi:putative transposase